jgi:hypothetical protein
MDEHPVLSRKKRIAGERRLLLAVCMTDQRRHLTLVTASGRRHAARRALAARPGVVKG